jgi:hypothetical protein
MIGGARGLVWIWHWPSKPVVAGSNPAASVHIFWRKIGSVVDNKPFRSASDLVENAVILLKEKWNLKNKLKRIVISSFLNFSKIH